MTHITSSDHFLGMAGTQRQQSIRKALRALAPGIPLADAQAVVALAERRHMKDLPPTTALWLALGSHVRHVHTDYEHLLADGYDREAARFFVVDDTDAVLAGWGCQRSVADLPELEEDAVRTRISRS
ncbi:DUF2293 domain-containing protein [Bosea sp. (in: a-proteobacteria)]|uniref:DUF2293 domain-containing protein n=1 Tax=Bosea sp. (in: a-proteobacteria) TaxID=1871050 RepID=UPI003561DDF6